jgi:DNA anti-recombination protein RmuC
MEPSLESKIEAVTKVVLDLIKTLHEAVSKIDANFEILEKRLDTIEAKIDNLETASYSEFKNVGGKLDELHVEAKKIQKVSNYTEQYENLLKIS